jgi:hypothetical protein
MTLSRRTVLNLAAAALATSASGRALAQMNGAMPSPGEMQVIQHGGLYANLKDPNIRELPPAPSPSALPTPQRRPRNQRDAGQKHRRYRFHAARWRGPPWKVTVCT